MRISDWSSDVCSSDLRPVGAVAQGGVQHRAALRHVDLLAAEHGLARALDIGGARQGQQLVQRLRQDEVLRIGEQQVVEIGRPSCRERVFQYVLLSVVAVSLKKQTTPTPQPTTP